ncbi:MAG: polyprenyl synthetase family protein [Candidatus Eremiobacterota bacterium]
MSFEIGLIKEELEAVKNNIKGLTGKFGAENFPSDYGGEMFRAVIFFLSLKLLNGKIDVFAIELATVMEEIYLASLLHDQIVDDNTKKAALNINYKKKNKTSILIADYILSIVITFLLHEDKPSIYEPVINAILSMCEGGLLKLKLSSSLATEEQDYIHTIEKGFASITSVAAMAGAVMTGAGSDEVDMLRNYGRDMGIAFQLSKDISDIAHQGTDKHIYDFRLSLPLIYAYNKAGKEEKELLSDCYSSLSGAEHIKSLIHRYNGSCYTARRMADYVNSARTYILPFMSSEAKEILYNLGNNIREMR